MKKRFLLIISIFLCLFNFAQEEIPYRHILKITFFFVLILFLHAAKTKAQTVSDTIFVYDTVIVKEIKTVYDTIKVPKGNLAETKQAENFLKKNDTAQRAVLAIDTATSKAQLVLLKKNDTATISINSILLSENLNNSDTMKKKILALAAAALIAQPNFAQQKDTLQKPKERAYTIETIVFRNKKIPQKIYRVTLPTMTGIRFNKGVNWKTFFPADSGHSHWALRLGPINPGIITDMDDSLITIKYQQRLNLKQVREYNMEIKKIIKDKTLSDLEKEDEYFKLTYTESVTIPLASVKSISFSRFNSPNKKFRYTLFNRGFNEYIKQSVTGSYLYAISSFTPVIYMIMTGPAFSLPPVLALFGAGVVLDFSAYAIMSKKIILKQWEINKN